MIRRLEFDELLVRLACEAGADLLEGVEVTQASLEEGIVRLVDRRGRFYRAPFVIAADGVNSVVARRLGLNAGWPAAHLALDMMEETPNDELRAADPGAIWVSYCPGGSHGYAYVFPKRDHVNVGTGYVLSYFRGQTAEKPYAMQRQLVEGLASRGILVGSSSRRHFMPYLIPVGGPLPNTGLARVLLVGDAGGFVNGYTAEGIYYAMVTGELAGQALMDSGHSPLARYTSAWRREVGAELRDAVVVQRYLFGASTRVDRVVAGARLEPDAARALIDYAVGALSYREARGQFFRRFPTLPLRLAWTLLADELGRRSPTQGVARQLN
jgi:flavin-dependent dehydrogenase